jgi:hypothetical protein
VRKNMKKEEDEENQSQYQSNQEQTHQNQQIPSTSSYGSSSVTSVTSMEKQNEDDDIKLKNRNIVLNFGEKGDEDEQEPAKEQWEPSNGSGNSTPHGNMGGKDFGGGENYKNKQGVDFYGAGEQVDCLEDEN